jgi:hypothetical protein
MNESQPGGCDGLQSMLRMWTDFAQKMTQMGAVSPSATPPEAARQMRSTMLDAWTQAWDQWMRSPQFLEMMRQSMASSVDSRRQWNNFLGEMQHQFQSASRQDVDELMLAMRHLEQRMVDAVEKIDHRLDGVLERLDCLAAAQRRGDDRAARRGPADEDEDEDAQAGLNGRGDERATKANRGRSESRRAKP